MSPVRAEADNDGSDDSDDSSGDDSDDSNDDNDDKANNSHHRLDEFDLNDEVCCVTSVRRCAGLADAIASSFKRCRRPPTTAFRRCACVPTFALCCFRARRSAHRRRLVAQSAMQRAVDTLARSDVARRFAEARDRAARDGAAATVASGARDRHRAH